MESFTSPAEVMSASALVSSRSSTRSCWHIAMATTARRVLTVVIAVRHGRNFDRLDCGDNQALAHVRVWAKSLGQIQRRFLNIRTADALSTSSQPTHPSWQQKIVSAPQQQVAIPVDYTTQIPENAALLVVTLGVICTELIRESEDISRKEGEIPKLFGQDAHEINGSRPLLDSIKNAGVPWAIVTSGTRPLVTGWLKVMELAQPAHLVVAEDVRHGKPDPECYSLAWQRLGLAEAEDQPNDGQAGHRRRDGIVFEDAPAGIKAGKAAGFRVVALATTHTIEQLEAAEPDWIVKDLTSVQLVQWDSRERVVTIQVSNSLSH